LYGLPAQGQALCQGGDSCCDNKVGGCGVNEGDCDNNDQCSGNLQCGNNNCIGEGFDSTDDCCYGSDPVPAPTGPPVSIPAPGNTTIQVTCDQIKNMHLALAYARIARHCPERPASGDQTECDRRLLLDLTTCSNVTDQNCFFQLIADEEVCFPVDGSDDICGALDRIINFVFFARQAFCIYPEPRTNGCGYFHEYSCTSSVSAARTGCIGVGASMENEQLIPCILGVLGQQAGCVPCVCDIIGCPGNRRLVSWATLAESVTIRHFRSEDFPVEQDTSAIWQLGQDVSCQVEGPLGVGLESPKASVSANVSTPENWPTQVKPMKVLTHGFTDSVSPDHDSDFPFFVNAWTNLYGNEYDVLLVDWHPLTSSQFNYNQASHYALDVGRYLGVCLASLANSGRLDDRIHLVGHSLGAHVMGKAGRVFRGQHQHESPVMRLTGLDPAGPRWFDGDRDAFPYLHNNIISFESAAFVDIIHTNADLSPTAASWSKPAYGGAFQLGHMDFYPDGGYYQTGCDDTPFPSCSHGRAVKYYYWSLYDPDYFRSQACESVDNCQNDLISDSSFIFVARMGERSSVDYAGGRQLLYTDITDTCWSYTEPPTSQTNC